MEPSRVTLEEAQELLKSCMPGIKKEEKPAADCLGQILAEPVCAAVTQPPFPRSAMDGFALRSRDVRRADAEHPITLEVTGCVYAGQETKLILGPYQTVQIMTGAMIPERADCVVKQEDTDYIGQNNPGCKADAASDIKSVQIYHNAESGENYCPQGEDFLTGDLLAEAGAPVDAYLLAAVTAAGVRMLTVYKRLKAAVITTGDELQQTDRPLEPGKIYDANGIWLCARLKEIGCDVVRYQTAGDDKEKIAAEIRTAWKEADLILTTGGVSVGEKDLLPDVIESLNGKVLFHGIRVKPGMPTMLSVVNGIPVLSLSGNPFAVAALFELLVGEYLAERIESGYTRKKQMKILKQTFVKTGKLKRIVKGRCGEDGVFLPQIQRNGQLKNGIGSNCLVIFPEGERTYPEGEEVQVIRI